MATLQSIRQPSVRTSTNWSPALLKTALIQADAGNFRTLSDLVDWIIADDRVGTVGQTRVGGLLGLPIQFERAGDRRRSGRAVKALEVEEDWWTIAPETEAFQIYLWALVLGFCWARLEYVKRKGRLLPTIRFWHPRNIRFDWATGRWFTRVADAVGSDNAAEVEIAAGTGEWVFFSPYGTFRPWAHGLWRGLSRWVLLKSYAIDDWGRHSEKGSALVAETAKDAMVTEPSRKALAADMMVLGRDGVIAPPPGVTVKLVEATANTLQLYDAQIQAANMAIAIAMLGQNLTTEVKSGSFAAAQIHGRVEGQRIRGDAEFESTTMHDQVLEFWAELNFGSRELAPWPMRDTDVPEDAKVIAEVAKLRAEAYQSMRSSGVIIDAEAWFERGEIEITEIREPEPPPAQLQPGAPGQQQQPPDAENPGQGQPAPAEKQPPKPAPKEKARLASGFDIENAGGFVAGQGYADALAERGAARGAQSLAVFLEGVLDAVDGIESLEDARETVRQHYENSLAPEELSDRAEKLFVMAQLGGRLAVRQDIPELKKD